MNQTNTELVVLPIEVQELASKVSANKQAEINTVLNQIFVGTADWEKQIDAIEIKDIGDKMSIHMAEVARKNSKAARLSAEKIFDAKRAEVQNIKAEYDLEDKLWLKAKQVMQLKFKAIEEKAEWKADFVKRHEADVKELRTQNRIIEVGKYNAEINRFEFENMSDESFASFLNGLKVTHENKLAEEKAAKELEIETARIAKEKQEAIEKENERLRLENEAKEKELEAQRVAQKQEADKAEAIRLKEREAADKLLEAQRKAAEDKAKKEKAISDKKLADAKAESEKLAKELQAKKEEDAKIETERIKKEEAEKKEKRKAELAPDKDKLIAMINDCELSQPTMVEEQSLLILGALNAKFEGFKKWALIEINKL